MGVRNTAAFFTDIIPIDLSGADVPTPDCVGLYIETGGTLKVKTYSGGSTVRTLVVGDKAWVPGMIATVMSSGNGTTATGIHYLV